MSSFPAAFFLVDVAIAQSVVLVYVPPDGCPKGC